MAVLSSYGDTRDAGGCGGSAMSAGGCGGSARGGSSCNLRGGACGFLLYSTLKVGILTDKGLCVFLFVTISKF